MKILFLHGWHSVPGGVKPSFLAAHGHQVINPALDDDDFDAAVRKAQDEYDRHRPDVIVGSSRGGAIAMNLDAATTPMVLLCPAWKRWGSGRTVKPGTVDPALRGRRRDPDRGQPRTRARQRTCPTRPSSLWAPITGSPIPSRSAPCSKLAGVPHSPTTEPLRRRPR